MTSTATNQLATKLLHFKLQNFNNPQILVSTNKNDSTVFSTFSYLNLLSAHFKLLFKWHFFMTSSSLRVSFRIWRPSCVVLNCIIRSSPSLIMPLQELCIQGNIQLLSNCLGIHCFTDQQQFFALHVCDCMCVVSKEIKEKQATMRWTQT